MVDHKRFTDQPTVVQHACSNLGSPMRCCHPMLSQKMGNCQHGENQSTVVTKAWLVRHTHANYILSRSSTHTAPHQMPSAIPHQQYKPALHCSCRILLAIQRRKQHTIASYSTVFTKAHKYNALDTACYKRRKQHTTALYSTYLPRHTKNNAHT